MRSLLVFCFILNSYFTSANPIAQKIEQFQADRGAVSRRYANAFTPEYYDRMDQLMVQTLAELRQVSYTSLAKHEKVDYHLFQNYLNKTLYFHRQGKSQLMEVWDVVDFAEPLYVFVRNRRDGKKPNAPELAKIMAQMQGSIQVKIKQVKTKGPYSSWQQAELASQVVEALRQSLKDAYQFYQPYDPEFAWWVPAPYQTLMGELEKYEKFLKDHFQNTSVKDDGSGIIGKPIGKQALEKELAYEMIPYTPEELIMEAEKQYAWCEKEMIKASEELGFGKNWKAALEHVKQTYVAPGEWPSQVHAFAVEAIDYLEKRDLVTIPPLAKETWRMTMMPAAQQKVSPFFLGGEVIQIAYPTDDMTHAEKMMSLRGNNPHFSRATVQHELIPGHHLQQFMNQRYATHRRLFNTPFWIEGWALYWEFNLWDKQFPRNAADRVGMLYWRMHRCARIVFSLNYHLGNMMPQACIDYLVEKVGHERANAEAEVRRSFTGRYGPLYQIAYMIGGLQFYQLKKELVDSGKLTEKQFHDTILQNNAIPVELVRTILKNEDLPLSFQSQWKFLTR
ncbi:MAG: DUF885 family protein [Spirosomataceae bacterium]